MKKILIVLALLVVGYGLYYFISPLFDVKEVDDAVPIAVLPEVVITKESETTTEPEVIEISTPKEQVMAQIQSTTGHPASGQVRVIETTTGQVIRFENFKTINGPNLHLYLSKDIEGKEFIDLGPIKGTEGNINYEVPAGINLAEYKYVMHWCVPFGVLFNYAQLL
jgi:hypothetical protein